MTNPSFLLYLDGVVLQCRVQLHIPHHVVLCPLFLWLEYLEVLVYPLRGGDSVDSTINHQHTLNRLGKPLYPSQIVSHLGSVKVNIPEVFQVLD